MPDTLMLTASTGSKNFNIFIKDRDEIAFDKEGFNPENEGRLLADTMWHMLPWATVQSMMDRLNELEGMEE